MQDIIYEIHTYTPTLVSLEYLWISDLKQRRYELSPGFPVPKKQGRFQRLMGDG